MVSTFASGFTGGTGGQCLGGGLLHGLGGGLHLEGHGLGGGGVVQSFSTSTAFSLVAVVVVASVWHWWRCAFSSASAFFASVWWSPRSRPSLFRCGGLGLGGQYLGGGVPPRWCGGGGGLGV